MFRNLLVRVGSISLACGLAMASAVYAQPAGYEGYQVVRIAITDEAGAIEREKNRARR